MYYMFRVVDDDIESPFKIVPDIFNWIGSLLFLFLYQCKPTHLYRVPEAPIRITILIDLTILVIIIS